MFDQAGQSITHCYVTNTPHATNTILLFCVVSIFHTQMGLPVYKTFKSMLHGKPILLKMDC